MRNPDKLEELSHELHKLREEYLKWKQMCDRYERGKHWKFATIFQQIPPDGTIEVRKQKAYAHPQWQEYIEEWNHVDEMKMKAQVKFENVRNDYEAFQSALSFDRETVKRLGG